LVLTVESGTCGYAYMFMFHMVPTSRKVAGSIPDGVTGIFHSHNPSDRTMVLGLTQPYHVHMPIVLKSGCLKLLEPSGPVQACNGTAFMVLTIASHYLLIWHLPVSFLMCHTVLCEVRTESLSDIYIFTLYVLVCITQINFVFGWLSSVNLQRVELLIFYHVRSFFISG
jgi:hypothetical protein